MRDEFDVEEDESECASMKFADQRGWSTKHGHRKRLLKPKRGKAALRAEIQGQGKEVVRGRSAFSRTIGHRGKSYRNASPDWRGKYGSDYPIRRRRTKLRKMAVSDAWEASNSFKGDSLAKVIDDYIYVAEEHMVEPDDFSVWSEQWNEEFESDSCIGEDSSLDEDSESLCESLSSSQTTAASVPEIFKSLTATVAKENMEHSVPTPWDLAMDRAEIGALLYEMFSQGKREPLPQPVSQHQKKSSIRNSSKRRKKLKTRPFNESDLWKLYKTYVSFTVEHRKTQRSSVDMFTAFQKFREDFLRRHGMKICAGLQSCFQCPIQLEPAPLGFALQQRFLEGIHGRLDGTWCPAFHGTSTKNLHSIYRRGLLIPGVGNDLRVAHGSAHGLGIYAATANNPWLSWGFCDGKNSGSASMLVCAVLDDSSTPVAPTSYGSFQLRSESANIRRVGGAFVVFEPTRIVPLFVASQCREPPRECPLAIDKDLRNKVGPRSSTSRGRHRREADVLRRRLIAISGHSVALSCRTKERKKGMELLGSRRTQYMMRA